VKLTEPQYYPSQNKTRYNVEHEALTYLSVTGTLNATVTSGGSILYLYEMIGDTIYNTDGSQVYKIIEKKIFVAESEKIYYIDDKGQIIRELFECSA
jgi:hypothetical protein